MGREPFIVLLPYAMFERISTKIKSFSTLAIVFYPNTYFPCNTGNLIEFNF